MGYLIAEDPDPWRSRGQVSVMEHDTLTCGHCGRVVKLVINKDVRPERAAFELDAKSVSGCRRCGQFVCDPCRRFGCDPIEAKLERLER